MADALTKLTKSQSNSIARAMSFGLQRLKSKVDIKTFRRGCHHFGLNLLALITAVGCLLGPMTVGLAQSTKTQERQSATSVGGPSLQETVNEVSDDFRGTYELGYEESKIYTDATPRHNTRISGSPTGKDPCHNIQLNAGPDGDSNAYNGGIFFSLDPIAVTVSSTLDTHWGNGTSYDTAFRCAHVGCIIEQILYYKQNNERVEKTYNHDELHVFLDEPNAHRVFKALIHLQKLCGGATRNPFD